MERKEKKEISRKRRKKVKDKKQIIPFSKKNVIYARLEAYIFSLILIAMVWLGKDVTAIAILLSLAWSGYKGLQCFYIWMCKHEHIEELKQKRISLGMDTSDLEMKTEELNVEEFNSDNYIG